MTKVLDVTELASARERVREANASLQEAMETVKDEQAVFAVICREVYELGLNDRMIADECGYSRARIQQFRKARS